VQQALKKQIISVFETMYLDVLNDNIVGFANISARYMLDHLLGTYGNITEVDLEINFEHMRQSWDPQQPAESLLTQIQECTEYSEAGGVLLGHPQKINVGYANIFATGHFISACRWWNEKLLADKTWAQFRAHFAAAHRQHKQMQGNPPQHRGTILPTQLLDKHKTKWLKLSLEHWITFLQQLQRIAVWWRH
jgi:hypothetical protein